MTYNEKKYTELFDKINTVIKDKYNFRYNNIVGVHVSGLLKIIVCLSTNKIQIVLYKKNIVQDITENKLIRFLNVNTKTIQKHIINSELQYFIHQFTINMAKNHLQYSKNNTIDIIKKNIIKPHPKPYFIYRSIKARYENQSCKPLAYKKLV